MRYKTPEIESQHISLQWKGPALWGVLGALDSHCHLTGWADPTITSIWRTENDPYKMHQSWRAADLRISNKARGDRNELSLDHWIICADLINGAFVYGETASGRITTVCKIRRAALGHHEDPLNDHVHIQVPNRASWL